MTASLMPEARQRYYTNVGLPLAHGKVYTYAAGTSTLKATYQDAAGTVPHSNPIVLDAKGEALIFWNGAYKVDVKTALGGTVTGYPVDNYISSITPADLSATSGSGLIGFLYSATYAAGTIGKWLKDLATSVGSSLIGFIQAGIGAVLQTIQGKLRLIDLDVEDFGATGDGVADDWAGITACLAAAKARGGNVTVRMSKRYRITRGLKLPSFVRIKGPMPCRYPYNNASPAPALIADFTDPNQWVIEPETTSGGVAVPYNTLLTALPSGPTYNCAVQDLLIKSVGVMPFGGIRMHGCPGAIVEGVGILDTGAGLLVNECFGGRFQVHTITFYYGVIAWGESNANEFVVYCTQDASKPKTVPAGYLFPGLAALNGIMVSDLGLSTNAHYNRTWGGVFGAQTGATSSGCKVDFTSEYFDGGRFMYNASSWHFTQDYTEGAANDVSFVIAAANSSISSATGHAYLSGTGTYIDPGVSLNADIRLDGVIGFATFKTHTLNNTSRLTMRGISRTGIGSTVPESNVPFPDDPSTWIVPTLLNSWVNAGGINPAIRYRLTPSGDVQMVGIPISGVVGSEAFILPPGYRPAARRVFTVPQLSGPAIFGVVYVLATGEVIPTTPVVSANGIDLSSIVFRAEQ